jgi:hypothetical protein
MNVRPLLPDAVKDRNGFQTVFLGAELQNNAGRRFGAKPPLQG